MTKEIYILFSGNQDKTNKGVICAYEKEVKAKVYAGERNSKDGDRFYWYEKFPLLP